MITIEVKGDRELIAKLTAMPAKVQSALTRKTDTLARALQAKVQGKLSGEVLNVRTGNLRRSIKYRVDASAASVTGTVFSSGDVKYAAIHEFGGTTRPHVIEASKASVLAFMMGGKQVFAARVNHPGSKIPARPYMRPSLSEMTPQIIAGLNDAVREGLQ